MKMLTNIVHKVHGIEKKALKIYEGDEILNRIFLILLTLLFFLLVPTAMGAVMDNAYLVNITINNTENVTFANHNESKIEGNWISLSGGTPVTLPGLTFIYYGVNVTNHTHDGSYINITANVQNYTDYNITYPYLTHPMYINDTEKNVVNISFNGSSYFANERVDIYLVNTTPTALKNAFNDVSNGNTTTFRDLLSEAYNKSLNQTLDNSGDYNMSFDPLDAGDYVIFVLLNSSSSLLANSSDLSILSATAFQVLEYESEVIAPSTAETDSLVPVTINLTNAGSGNYTYGAVLVHENAYEAAVKLTFNGSRDQTNLTADGAYLIQGYEIAGIGLNNVNKSTIQNLTETIIGANNGTVLIKPGNSTNITISLPTLDLLEGDYLLIIGVYKSGERLVAFNQTTIKISKPTPPPPPSSGGGGGGGGGTSGEAYENIICSETDRQFVGKDQEVGYSFKLDCNYVKHINFTGLSSSGKVAAKVEILNHTSSMVDKEAPNIVFKNLNVWIGNMGWFSDSNVKDPNITFMVDRSWVKNNNIILNTISFYSYNDDTSTWEKMSTRKIGEDQTSYYFKASLPIRGTLGPMAVSGRGATSFPTPVITPTRTITAQPTPEITPAATPTTWTGLWKEKVPGFQILMALIVLIVLYLSGRRRNND